jgi:hypothetical protein
MDKYQLDLPLPSQGVNYLDDSLISDREAAEGTVNVSFKNGLPQTRKGFLKQALYAHDGEGYDITRLDMHYVGGEKRMVFASNSHLYQLNEDKSPVRRDLGSIAGATPCSFPLPCAMGTTRGTLETITDMTVKSLATKTFTVNEIVTSAMAQALIGRRVTIKGITYSIASAAAGEPGLGTFTVNETVTGSPAANDTITMRNNMTVKSIATKTFTIYEVLSPAEAAALVGRTVVIKAATYTIASAVGGAAGAGTFTVNETVTGSPADGDIVTATSIAYSEKVIVLDGDDIRWFDESTALSAVQCYCPTTAEISAYGTNVLITTPDEIKHQKWMVNDDNRLWVAGNGNLVRISHLGTAGAMPDYWPSTQAIKLSEGCTGLARYRGDVMIFTKNTASVVTGSTPVVTMDDSYKNIQLPGNFGCERHETIAQGDNAIYWANPQGVYRYTYQPSGYSIPECVSEMTIPHQDGTSHIRTVRKKLAAITDWTKVFAVFYDHEYRLYIGGSEVLCFDTLNNSWALYDYDKTFICGTVYEDQLFYAETKTTGVNAFIYEMDYTFDLADLPSYDGLSDDGVAFTATLKSKYFDFDKAANKKRFKKLYLSLYSDLVSYNLDVILNVDNEDTDYLGVVENKISRWGSNDPITDPDPEAAYVFCFGDVIRSAKTNLNYPVRIHHRGKRYNIQYTLTSDDLNTAWALKDAVLLMKVKELK